jgi:hypothetical protein
MMFAASLMVSPSYAKNRRDAPPPPYSYCENRRDPPPGHEFRPRDDRADRWDDRRQSPPNWNRHEWELRQRWLRQHGRDEDNHDSAAGLIVGIILGFGLGAAVVDSQDQQQYAESRLNNPAWIANCARRYRSFDPYTGTYLGYDGLRQ